MTTAGGTGASTNNAGPGSPAGPGFTGRHAPPRAILMAPMLFAMGVSPEGITPVPDQQMNLKVHRVSVQRRADRYARLLERYAGGLRPSTGGVRSCGERPARAYRGPTSRCSR